MLRRIQLAALGVLLGAPASAVSLRIEPVLVEVFAPQAATTLTVRSEDAAPIDMQIRVFRWSQSNGEETLEPTDDVVASPPAVTVKSQIDHVVRIVRVTKRPLLAEESYRLLVDQLPDRSQQRGRTINLIFRQSIPVFFGAPDNARASVTWSIVRNGQNLSVVAQNSGDSRLRISNLNVRDAKGVTTSLGDGLLGYVLGRSTMNWTLPQGRRGLDFGGSVLISAQSSDGPIHVQVPVLISR